jgi:hypothetical protein
VGEKGLATDAPLGAPGAGSIIERTSTMVTTTVADVGNDLIETVRDTSIGAVADQVVDAAGHRLRAVAGDEEREGAGPVAGQP